VSSEDLDLELSRRRIGAGENRFPPAPRRRFWPLAPLLDSSEMSRPSDPKLAPIMIRASPMEAVRDHDV
jgi:hypothetical protein